MKKQVVITGLGMIGDFGTGKQDFCNFIEGKKQKRELEDFNFDDYIDTMLLRRADQVSYFASIAAKLAIEDAESNKSNSTDRYKYGVIVGTVHGALDYTIDYHRALVLEKPSMVSPLLFSNSVLNAAASSISNVFKIRGYVATIAGYASVHQAIKSAITAIGEGSIDICLAGGVDVNNDFLVGAYSGCVMDSRSIADNFGGSGFIVLESLESAIRRKANIYGEVLGIEITTGDLDRVKKGRSSPLENLNYHGAEYVLTSSFFDVDSAAREKFFLKKFSETNISVLNCGNLFGCTFAAAESFQIILSILKLQESNGKVLTNLSTQTGANAALLIAKVDEYPFN